MAPNWQQTSVEGRVLERQGQGVGLAPVDAAVADLPRGGVVEHRLVEVGDDIACVGRKQPRRQRARDGTPVPAAISSTARGERDVAALGKVGGDTPRRSAAPCSGRSSPESSP